MFIRAGRYSTALLFRYYFHIMNMDSIITQQQLNMLLAGMRDSVPKKNILEALDKATKLDPFEKNAIYHKVLDTIKDSQNPKNAAISILEYLQDVVSERLNLAVQSIDVSYGDGSSEDGKPTTGVGSPIFRRVG